MDSIGITGNPGTGKKTIASKLSEKIKRPGFPKTQNALELKKNKTLSKKKNDEFFR